MLPAIIPKRRRLDIASFFLLEVEGRRRNVRNMVIGVYRIPDILACVYLPSVRWDKTQAFQVGNAAVVLPRMVTAKTVPATSLAADIKGARTITVSTFMGKDAGPVEPSVGGGV